jgi:hypothetical protein
MISNVRNVILFFALAFTVSCSKNSDNNSDAGNNYILLTNEADIATPGYVAARAQMPQGNISNIGANSLQVAEAFGFTQYKEYIFTRTNVAGQTGIQRFTVGTDGRISEAGFIADGQMFHIVDDNTGYYLDEKRGTMLIQTFNPSSMQRTGQIDLSSLSQTGVEYQVVGKHILASKEGKLYVSVTYGTTALQGYGDNLLNYALLAVIDIAANKLEKTIQYNGIKGLGWGSSANKFWTLGDDGALYFYYTGFDEGISNSTIVRIKKGETDFDKTWVLKADNLQNHSTIATALVKNGTIYIQLPSVELKPDFSNLADPMWDFYAVNINTLKATKITGMPHTRYVHSNEQGIVQIDGKIYLWMANATTKENGYYLLNESTNTASSAFNVTDGGLVSGFIKLDN